MRVVGWGYFGRELAICGGGGFWMVEVWVVLGIGVL